MTWTHRFVAVTLLFALQAAPAQGGPAEAGAASMRSMDLWPSQPPQPPAGAGDAAAEHRSAASTSAAPPRIDLYRPAHPNGSAVLVIAGGGYEHIALAKEALPAARWLVARGVTAAVLHYRLPGGGVPAVAPFQDAQRAMRQLRADAGRLGIDAARIGVLGFSAGGNLAGITATRFDAAFYAPRDAVDRLSARPDFAALIYPVISLQPPFDTTQASRRLSIQADAASAYSVELHVTQATPPVFLAQAVDDPIASVGNSRVMFDALLRQHVPAEMHLFERGGHGWGMGEAGTPVAAWPQLFADWAQSHGFLTANGTDVAPAKRMPERPALRSVR